MPPEARSISRICDSHPEQKTHTAIWKENRYVPRCSYCGKRWPNEINVDDSDSEVISAAELRRGSSSSTTGYISSQGRVLTDLTRSRSPSSSTSSPRGREGNLMQYQHIMKMTREAHAATRAAAKASSPLDNPIGLSIRVKILHSEGYNLLGGFFNATKIRSIGILPPCL
jgi:hypothetical protein